ncbi:DEAD/DEAH box helicase [Caulobacter sp. BP25]|uniref:DEAD/DEAH box helicase n=1 Tax=Caulobacter sp. BP25 TaxID=2048900 RepID=UPI000C12D84D|nr:DEAD/DEAH box helicase [Caulobacter sp. BP25]PHY22389.1 DEAD/DEAH box helicase [Caulobacter sp. BP25]
MFDPDTAAFLRSAPALPTLASDRIPLELTEAYAQLVTARLREDPAEPPARARLANIADTYELIAVVSDDKDDKRASAFVAATAQQILAKGVSEALADAGPLSRDEVHPALAACLLFLAAEQYPDANEAANALPARGESSAFTVETLLSESILALAKGHLLDILNRARRRGSLGASPEVLPAEATSLLYAALLDGVELLASELLAQPHPLVDTVRFERSGAAFDRVLELATLEHPSAFGDRTLTTTYPGPAHLARLLKGAGETLGEASIQTLPPPKGADEGIWKSWLAHRAKTKPLLWPNHRSALKSGFHETGRSALLTLPTGAGKTTVAEFKIAGVLARKQAVIFLVPTHALADQLRDDLAEAFPDEIIDGSVTTDFDLLLQSLAPPARIEVMTPEMCLARLSLGETAFDGVGLLVFDECHMLSPAAGSLRRALDGMFAVLGFLKATPKADLLFLSAMVKDGRDFADWIHEQTGRQCLLVDPIWKPSRQARGVVLYEAAKVKTILASATSARALAGTKGLGKAAKAHLQARPYVLFGLQHNWNNAGTTDITISELLASDVSLDGTVGPTGPYLLPNANVVSSAIATASAKQGLKTIVFVTTAQQTITNAARIAEALQKLGPHTAFELELRSAIEEEMGPSGQSLVPNQAAAVPHSADLLPIERRLVETYYRRKDGASVIVATTTLSQGMNLPSEVAILSGDKRADLAEGGREALKAHELLNAAGRAGRAGHLANGVVILVPEAILKFTGKVPDNNAKEKLRSILPESDRCIELDDPLNAVLDYIQTSAAAPEVSYVINRLQGDAVDRLEDLKKRSFASFQARKKSDETAFASRIGALKVALDASRTTPWTAHILELSAQSGAAAGILQTLADRLSATEPLPQDVGGWIGWMTDWFAAEPLAAELLGSSEAAARSAVKIKKTANLTPHWPTLKKALEAWVNGRPLAEIEVLLGGSVETYPHCPRAREIATDLATRGFSYAASLVVQVLKAQREAAGQDTDQNPVTGYLATAIKRGFNSQDLVAFAMETKGPLTRVQYHRAHEKAGNAAQRAFGTAPIITITLDD